MATATKVEFDILKSLHVIEHDKDLNKLLKHYAPNISFNMLVIMAQQNMFPPDLTIRVREIFTSIILETPRMLKVYEEFDVKTLAPRAPKYYGKKKILQDMQNNPKTEVDSALLALNDLRNVMAQLRRRCIKEKVSGEGKLVTTDYREIVAAIKILKNRVKPLIKK